MELIVPILLLVFLLVLPLYLAIRATKKNEESQEIIDILKGRKPRDDDAIIIYRLIRLPTRVWVRDWQKSSPNIK